MSLQVRALIATVLASLPLETSADGVLKIAILGPMAFVHGEDQWAGAELARDAINGSGGISMKGKRLKIELVRIDTNDMQSITDATNAVERAITRDKADVLIGGLRSEAVLAMQEVAVEHRKLFISCGASDAKLSDNVARDHARYKYWFRGCTGNTAAMGKTLFAVLDDIAAQVRRDLKIDEPRVAILAEKVLWTGGVVKQAREHLPKMRMQVVGVWQPAMFARDVTAELAAIERAGADIVLTAFAGPVGIVVARQMGERNMKAIPFGINVEAPKSGFWEATAGRGNHVATLDTFAEVELTDATLPFVRAFKARFGRMPTYTAGTYDAIRHLRAAIEKAGTTDPDALVVTLENMRFVAAGAVVEFDRAHDPIWAWPQSAGIAVQWQDGKQVPFWPPGVKGMGTFKLPTRR